MSQALWVALIVNLCGVLTVWGKAYFDYKAKKGNSKKDTTPTVNLGNNPHPCQRNGERIAALEASQEAMKEDNKEEHRQIRANIARIFTLLNGIKK